MARVKKPNQKYSRVRSVRVEDDIWEKAQRRAEFDGVAMTHVVGMLIEGYATGQLKLPKVQLVYSTPAASE